MWLWRFIVKVHGLTITKFWLLLVTDAKRTGWVTRFANQGACANTETDIL